MNKEQLLKVIRDNTSTPSWLPTISDAIDEYKATIFQEDTGNRRKSQLNENVIRNIDSLFPTDSGFDDTSKIGEALLAQAKRSVGYTDNWRNLPDEVLREYERLCVNEERKQTQRVIR